MKAFTFEVYCSNGKPSWRIHAGTFQQNRDSLSPQMYWARDFQASSLVMAKLKCQALVRTYKANGASLKECFCPMGQVGRVDSPSDIERIRLCGCAENQEAAQA